MKTEALKISKEKKSDAKRTIVMTRTITVI